MRAQVERAQIHNRPVGTHAAGCMGPLEGQVGLTAGYKTLAG